MDYAACAVLGVALGYALAVIVRRYGGPHGGVVIPERTLDILLGEDGDDQIPALERAVLDAIRAWYRSRRA